MGAEQEISEVKNFACDQTGPALIPSWLQASRSPRRDGVQAEAAPDKAELRTGSAAQRGKSRGRASSSSGHASIYPTSKAGEAGRAAGRMRE